MKIIVIFLGLLLTGCATKPVPVTQKWPQAPEQFMQPCQDLKKLDKEPKLSDVAKIVAENYTLYHECSIKTLAWQEWYKAHKRIFEEIK